jgi:hypothetical protein
MASIKKYRTIHRSNIVSHRLKADYGEHKSEHVLLQSAYAQFTDRSVAIIEAQLPKWVDAVEKGA